MLFEFLEKFKSIVAVLRFLFHKKIYKTIKFRSDGEMSIKFVRETFYFRPFFAINKLCSFFQHHQGKLFAFLENKQSKVAVLGLLFNKGNHKTIKFRRDGKMSIGVCQGNIYNVQAKSYMGIVGAACFEVVDLLTPVKHEPTKNRPIPN